MNIQMKEIHRARYLGKDAELHMLSEPATLPAPLCIHQPGG